MSEKKEPVRIGLGTLFLILIIFILATIILVMFLENKNIISINLKENEIISENQKVNNKVEDGNLREENIISKNTVNSNIEQEKSVYERLEDKYSSVEYRRETEASSGFFINDGIVYQGFKDMSETGLDNMTYGVTGIAKYVIPVNKQIGETMVLTEYGKVFLTVEVMGVQVVKFEELKLEYKIIEVINIPEEEGHLLVAEDGTILKMDGTIFGKV